MGRFPSGQREQTVNLPSLTSVVRIHPCPHFSAGMAELADAHDSGSCARTSLQVQVLFPALISGRMIVRKFFRSSIRANVFCLQWGTRFGKVQNFRRTFGLKIRLMTWLMTWKICRKEKMQDTVMNLQNIWRTIKIRMMKMFANRASIPLLELNPESLG